jgi:hypothetical protein
VTAAPRAPPTFHFIHEREHADALPRTIALRDGCELDDAGVFEPVQSLSDGLGASVQPFGRPLDVERRAT